MTTKPRKDSLVCSFDAAFLPLFFKWLRNCETCLTQRTNYSTQHKLLELKYWETKIKSTKKGFSQLRRTFINFSWLLSDLCFFTGRCTVRLDLPLEAFTTLCWGTTFIISKPFQFFHKNTMPALYVFKSSMYRVLTSFCWAPLRILFRGSKEF